ncbi:MAG: GNAT family N-acetyltransferase [Endozoicomonas sp. (ex Botrylloides leachii)]|nr:GNAT family N-acetyltransferase [Endozoicomonas sp. (ex Botrylloides leachii)]
MDLTKDILMIHSWVTQPYAKFWGLQNETKTTVKSTYQRIIQSCDVYIGYSKKGPILLLEVYNPANEAVGKHYPVRADDAGMHLLMAPPKQRKSGYTWQIFKFVMDFLFSSTKINRIVVEPDSQNYKIHALNQRAGFLVEKQIRLPEKSALLCFCTRNDYYQNISATRCNAI